MHWLSLSSAIHQMAGHCRDSIHYSLKEIGFDVPRKRWTKGWNEFMWIEAVAVATIAEHNPALANVIQSHTSKIFKDASEYSDKYIDDTYIKIAESLQFGEKQTFLYYLIITKNKTVIEPNGLAKKDADSIIDSTDISGFTSSITAFRSDIIAILSKYEFRLEDN